MQIFIASKPLGSLSLDETCNSLLILLLKTLDIFPENLNKIYLSGQGKSYARFLVLNKVLTSIPAFFNH